MDIPVLTMTSLDSMYNISFSTCIDSNVLCCLCIQRPMVNKETGLTQSPSHPRVLGIHARPRMQVSLGQFRYFPAVERLKTSPNDIPRGIEEVSIIVLSCQIGNKSQASSQACQQLLVLTQQDWISDQLITYFQPQSSVRYVLDVY